MSRGALLAAFLGVLPLACWPGSTSCIAGKHLLVGIGIAVWGIASCIARCGLRLRTSEKWILAGWTLLAVSAVLLSDHRILALKTHLLLGAGLVLASESARIGTEAEHRNWPTSGLVLGACLAGIISLLQSSGYLGQVAAGVANPAGSSTLGNPNRVGALCAIALFPSLSLWLGSGRGSWVRIGGGIVSIVLVSVIIATRATAPMAGLLAGSVCLLAFLGYHRSRRPAKADRSFLSAVLLVAIAAIGFIAWSIQPETRLPRKTPFGAFELVLDSNHWFIRRTDWIVAQQLFLEHPICGSGLGSYAVDWIDTRSALTRSGRYTSLAEHAPPAAAAHNDFLQWGAETGAVGIVAALGLAGWLALGWRRRSRAKSGEAATEHILLSSGLVCAGVIALVDFPMHCPSSAAAVWYLAGRVGWESHSPEIGSRLGRAARWGSAAMAGIGLAWGIGAFTLDLQSARLADNFHQGRIAEIPASQSHLSRLLSVGSRDRMYLGLAAWARGDSASARRELDCAMQEKPAFEALLARAELAIECSRFADAEKDLRTVVDCRPIRRFRRQASYLEGLLLLRGGRTGDARIQFTKTTELFPEGYRARMALGYISSLEGDRSRARREYREAKEVLEALLGGQFRDMDTTPRLRNLWLKHRSVVDVALDSLER